MKVVLRKDLAEVILHKLGVLVVGELALYDGSGSFISSINGNCAGRERETARAALQENLIFTENDAETGNVTSFIPINYKGEAIGVISICDREEVVRAILPFVLIAVESVLENYLSTEKEISVREEIHLFLNVWLFTEKAQLGSDFIAKAKIFGIKLETCRVVLMLQQNKEHHGDNAMVSRYLRKDEYLVNYKNNNMLIIASAHSGIVERIQRVFEFKSNSFKIFIGPESSDVNQSFQCVLSIVQVCQYFKVGGDIVHFKDIVLEKALFGIRDDYFIKTLKNIFEKKDHSFDLRNTIKAYFLYSGNNLKVCENLNIHRNTLLYRLKKIKEFTDKDPKCYKDLFILYCAALVNS